MVPTPLEPRIALPRSITPSHQPFLGLTAQKKKNTWARPTTTPPGIRANGICRGLQHAPLPIWSGSGTGFANRPPRVLFLPFLFLFPHVTALMRHCCVFVACLLTCFRWLARIIFCFVSSFRNCGSGLMQLGGGYRLQLNPFFFSFFLLGLQRAFGILHLHLREWRLGKQQRIHRARALMSWGGYQKACVPGGVSLHFIPGQSVHNCAALGSYTEFLFSFPCHFVTVCCSSCRLVCSMAARIPHISDTPFGLGFSLSVFVGLRYGWVPRGPA